MNDEFTELYTGIMEMSSKDESLFVPDEDSVSSSDEESSTAATEEPSNEYIRREHLNRFLETCNVQNLTRPRKRWAEAGARTHSNHVKKAKGVIVGFHMTSPKFRLKNYRSYRDFTFTMH